MIKEYHVVRFNSNYADEFDVEGIRIFDDWKEYQETMKKDVSYPHEFYFGTNEQLEFESYEDLMQSMQATRITQDQALVIANFVGDIGYFPEY